MNEEVTDLLKALISVTGRVAFDEEQLLQIIGKSPKLISAYNLCDGTRTQSNIVKELKVDKGNFSKTVNKWIVSGVLFKVGEGNDKKLLHLYPIPSK